MPAIKPIRVPNIVLAVAKALVVRKNETTKNRKDEFARTDSIISPKILSNGIKGKSLPPYATIYISAIISAATVIIIPIIKELKIYPAASCDLLTGADEKSLDIFLDLSS